MEWQKAKTILIWLFIFVNIFLLIVTVNNNKKDELNKEKLKTVFSQNNLEIDIEKLPKTSGKIFVNEIYGISYDDAAYLTENGSDLCSLNIEKNIITFTDPEPNNSKFKNVSSKNIVSKLKPFLKKLGVLNSVKATDIVSENGILTVDFSYIIDGYDVFSDKLSFKISDKGILECKGIVYIKNPKTGYSYEINNPETILLQMENIKSAKISDIKLGLYILNYEQAITFQVIPVYKIETDTKTYIYDARAGVDAVNRNIKGDNNG